MEKDLLTEIRGLKNKLILNNITIDNAVDRFSQLINQFQNDSTYDKEITLFDELSLSEIEKYFLEKNRKAIDRIATLNKILVLQELGIKFSPEELNNLISRNN
ncbi:hypothetical protein [Aquimarina longa]|uniref:hypothetical protein n=1 Tax=Aquimarina longa TaxID=1080221 RepID=UPI000A6498DE|nr:hypothetical protein [Aquimarina longa]